jgi:hypothetical protein
MIDNPLLRKRNKDVMKEDLKRELESRNRKIEENVIKMI